MGFIWSSTAKVKILPYHVYRQSEIWRQFFFRNQHELYKKGLFGGNPEPQPYCEKIKKKVEVLILPQHVYRSFEGKIIHTILEEKSLRIMQKQMGS